MEHVTPGPLRILFAAGPDVPEAFAWVQRIAAALRTGRVIRVLLTHKGLEWASNEGLRTLAEDPALHVAVCSRNAGDRGWSAERTPNWIGWSSVTTWFMDMRPGDSLWVVLP